MSKYFCISCGTPHTQKMGRCHICGMWGNIVEAEIQEKNEYIKPRSKKGQQRQNKKHETYNKIDDKAHYEGRFYCWGCGKTCGVLSRSHLIPVSERVDLEAVEANIWFMGCGNSDSCHDLWESHNIENIRRIPNHKEALKAVKELDSNYYFKLINKKSC